MKKTPVQKHFDDIAAKYNFYKTKNKFYYDNLKKLLSDFIPNNAKVLEVGCGTGDLIIHLNPKKGWGTDISTEMIRIAKKKYGLKRKIFFSTTWPKDKYEYIFMSDVIEHLENPDETFKKISDRMAKGSLFILTMANPLWEPILVLGEELGLKMPEGPHKRIKNEELGIMMKKAGLKVLGHDYRLLIPLKIPHITQFVNKYIEPFLKRFAFIEYLVAIKS